MTCDFLNFETESDDEYEIPIQSMAELIEEDDDFFDIEDEETTLLNRSRTEIPSNFNRSYKGKGLNLRASIESSISN